MNKCRIYKQGNRWIFQLAVPLAFSFLTWKEAVDYFLEYASMIRNLSDPSWDY